MQKQNERAFTIVELIISITIILLFTGTSVFIYQNVLKDKTFETDVKLFGAILNKARERTITRDISPVANCTDFEGYNLIINSDVSTVTEQIVCDVNASTIVIYTFPNSRFDNVAMNIRFSYPLATINPPLAQPIILRSEAGRCVDFTVNSVGAIVIGDEYDCP